jgi:hypothetical protein
MKTHLYVAMALGAISSLGCADLTSYELSARTEPPLGGRVTATDVEVVEGTAIGLRIALLSGSQLILPEDARFENAGAAAVLTAVDDQGNYLIGGSTVGDTIIVASAALYAGELEIPVRVLPQPPLD